MWRWGTRIPCEKAIGEKRDCLAIERRRLAGLPFQDLPYWTTEIVWNWCKDDGTDIAIEEAKSNQPAISQYMDGKKEGRNEKRTYKRA